MARKPPTVAQMQTAIEMRSQGQSWDAVAKELGRLVTTIRQWAKKYPDLWRQAHAQVERGLLDSANIESIQVLRHHLRAADEKGQREAAQKLLQQRAAFRKVKNRPQASPPQVESESRRIAAYLETLTDAQIQELLNDPNGEIGQPSVAEDAALDS